MRVLLVEDDPALSDLLRRALGKEGYAVDTCENGTDALWAITETDYDAVLLDVMIPSPNGFEVCREARRRGRWSPILLLTARDAVDDRVAGLDAGADDYLTKPFALAELFARLRAITRREATERPVRLQVGDLVLDPADRSVRRSDVAIELSPTEFSLLLQFMRSPDQVLSRTYLLEHVWDFAYEGTSNVVDVYVRYLREKIDRPFGRTSLQTVRGAGYVLRSAPNDDDEEDANGDDANGDDANGDASGDVDLDVADDRPAGSISR
jgi:two-component system, OmpR family, response regulator